MQMDTHTHINQCYYPWLSCIWRCKCKNDLNPTNTFTHACAHTPTNLKNSPSVALVYPLSLLYCITWVHQSSDGDDEWLCFRPQHVKAALGKNLHGKINPDYGNATKRTSQLYQLLWETADLTWVHVVVSHHRSLPLFGYDHTVVEDQLHLQNLFVSLRCLEDF